jgi:hypothetical protein
LTPTIPRAESPIHSSHPTFGARRNSLPQVASDTAQIPTMSADANSFRIRIDDSSRALPSLTEAATALQDAAAPVNTVATDAAGTANAVQTNPGVGRSSEQFIHLNPHTKEYVKAIFSAIDELEAAQQRTPFNKELLEQHVKETLDLTRLYLQSESPSSQDYNERSLVHFGKIQALARLLRASGNNGNYDTPDGIRTVLLHPEAFKDWTEETAANKLNALFKQRDMDRQSLLNGQSIVVQAYTDEADLRDNATISHLLSVYVGEAEPRTRAQNGGETGPEFDPLGSQTIVHRHADLRRELQQAQQLLDLGLAERRDQDSSLSRQRGDNSAAFSSLTSTTHTEESAQTDIVTYKALLELIPNDRETALARILADSRIKHHKRMVDLSQIQRKATRNTTPGLVRANRNESRYSPAFLEALARLAEQLGTEISHTHEFHTLPENLPQP